MKKVNHIMNKKFVIRISTDDSNEIASKKYYKVRDHYLYTGKNRRTAHNICNLRYKTPK